MRCYIFGLSIACGVLHRWRLPIAGPAKTLRHQASWWVCDGCERPLGGRAAPCARLAVRMQSRPAPASHESWRPPGSGLFHVLLVTILHLMGVSQREILRPSTVS
ncbi:unnamed protein product [Parnassius apollo]|uniref:(apollo) hypothetical protein n=1 Tax=Parnassius apollo TaxID=110799 RepID=A0A8S3XJS3_PARAO|nr:unnamed protein product [Parnassius apollo]